MGTIRFQGAGNTDWRSAIRLGQSSVSPEAKDDSGTTKKFGFDETVSVRGVEYWLGPERAACAAALNMPSFVDIGSFRIANNFVRFFDYHKSLATNDVRGRFLDTFQIASTESSFNGFQHINWKNCCTKSLEDVKRGMYDYLETFVWPAKCSEIVDCIDSHVRSDAYISDQELILKDVIIGYQFFNTIFYDTSLLVADAILMTDLMEAMYRSIPNPSSTLLNHTRPENMLITQFDEVERYIFRTNLEDGCFLCDWSSRQEKHWRCSPQDLGSRILPLIQFISNWSLVLGSYLAVA
ncbi:MAG: hypothetical protein Q4F23_01605 [Coriobacteriia bacterium]|nr:hypothetical protein [Coriobacteriia bacterium]